MASRIVDFDRNPIEKRIVTIPREFEILDLDYFKSNPGNYQVTLLAYY